MTATNHALTGAVIALTIKQPTLAIPLAFASHFALDAIPHYNPPENNNKTFKNFANSWSKKTANIPFLAIFTIDMLTFAVVLIIVPLAAPADVSPWTIFLSSLAAASPDFVGGRYLIYQLLKIMPENPNRVSLFSRFHIKVQWMERPWGIFVEIGWLATMVLLVHRLIA